ncbi:hypothetical protein FRC07_008914 [Ceratobasidium sp. 392]|nr:hypothetical protein FRC07_008914 [Ceratobasidium sp. 392]
MLLGKPTRKATEVEGHELFFNVQWELLNKHPRKALENINAARKTLGMGSLNISNSKPCLVAPKLSKEVHMAAGSSSNVNTEINISRQVSPPPKRIAKPKAPTPESEDLFEISQNTVATLEPTVSTGDSSATMLKSATRNDIRMKASDDELATSIPPTPSLVDAASVSGNSEIGTPSTASQEIPKISKQLSKNTRRYKRGGASRDNHNEKKIPTANSRKSLPNGVKDVAMGPEKPIKKTRKTRKQDNDLSIGGQSMRIALKQSLKTAQETYPIHESATPPPSDCHSPEAGNSLQLELGPPAANQRDNQVEAAPTREDTCTEPKFPAPQCVESSWRPLTSPSLSLVLEPSPPTSTAPPFLLPTSPSPIHSPCASIVSTPLPQVISHAASSAFAVEESSSSALQAEPQPETPPLSIIPTPTVAEVHVNDIHIPVWAVSRQELCELPYFKSMQGGVYTRAHTVYGYLLGRFPSPRDAWRHDGRLIVSHGGGKHMMNEDQIQPDDLVALAQSKHQLGDDQLETDSSIRGLLTSYRMFRPVVILAEADYEHLQKFNLKRGYAKEANYYVLGHYAIVAAWAEREEISFQGETSLYTRWKFAFQWIEQGQGPPWWLQGSGTAPRISSPQLAVRKYEISDRRSFNNKVSSRRFKPLELLLNPFPSSGAENKCTVCFSVSPKVYKTEWVCLNPDCEFFWTFTNELVPQGELQFDEDFLSIRNLPAQLQSIPYSIVPEYPAWEHQAHNCSIFNRNFWAGVCCHRCGRVSCRQRWQIWECPTCKLVAEESRPQIYPSSTLDDPLSWESYGNGRFNPTEITATCRVVRYPDDEIRVIVYYKLPEDIGQIVHVLNNPAASKAPDQLFEEYQKDACSRDMFQRHAIKTHGVKGELYAQHFTFNAGAPYKYIAEAISTPFEDCPDSIKGAVDHIGYLCKGALEKSTDFNELLSVAYAEGQEMNFHSDDEPGLGPVVAGLTLGSSAEMMFRPNVSIKKNLIYKNGPYRASESRTIDVQNEKLLQITLSHGDLLIMDGIEIQKYFEHAVFVRDTDLLRFAATARFINPAITGNSSSTLANSQSPRPSTVEPKLISGMPNGAAYSGGSNLVLDRNYAYRQLDSTQSF